MNRKQIVLTYWGIIGSVLLGGGIYALVYLHYYAYTDDSYVEGNQVMLTPLVSGFVQAILTDETYLVEKGQLLVVLDDTNAKIALVAAEEELATTVRQVCQDFHEVFALKSDIESKKAEFIKAAQDYEHREFVLQAGGVSVEDFEHSVAALRSSFFMLQMTEILFEKALALVQNTTIHSHPMILAAAAKARQSWVDLYRCKIYAPVTGLVAQRSIQVGMWVPSGKTLMAVIPLDQIWVNANFKETQMKRMRIGQKVKLTADLYGDSVVYHGRVAGLPGGAGNAFSLLPPQNLSGNWIKIVQRLPVRVELDPEELKKHPLRLGLSTEATVDLTDPGPLVPSSPKGAPNYITDIFREEELGDKAWVQKIIEKNLDPTLRLFLNQPIELGRLNE